MFELLAVVVVYTLVFGADYLFYLKLGARYNYVSRRTYAIHVLGMLGVLAISHDNLKPFIDNISNEFVAIVIITAVMLLIATIFIRNKLLICNTSSRTERCMTPGYVLVRGSDIFFQQIAYLAVALALVELLGLNILTFVSFMLILSIMHTPVVLSTNREMKQLLIGGLAVLSVPFLYTYISMGLLWPAIYIHAIVYVFLWIIVADMEGEDLDMRA